MAEIDIPRNRSSPRKDAVVIRRRNRMATLSRDFLEDLVEWEGETEEEGGEEEEGVVRGGVRGVEEYPIYYDRSQLNEYLECEQSYSKLKEENFKRIVDTADNFRLFIRLIGGIVIPGTAVLHFVNSESASFWSGMVYSLIVSTVCLFTSFAVFAACFVTLLTRAILGVILVISGICFRQQTLSDNWPPPCVVKNAEYVCTGVVGWYQEFVFWMCLYHLVYVLIAFLEVILTGASRCTGLCIYRFRFRNAFVCLVELFPLLRTMFIFAYANTPWLATTVCDFAVEVGVIELLLTGYLLPVLNDHFPMMDARLFGFPAEDFVENASVDAICKVLYGLRDKLHRVALGENHLVFRNHDEVRRRLLLSHAVKSLTEDTRWFRFVVQHHVHLEDLAKRKRRNLEEWLLQRVRKVETDSRESTLRDEVAEAIRLGDSLAGEHDHNFCETIVLPLLNSFCLNYCGTNLRRKCCGHGQKEACSRRTQIRAIELMTRVLGPWLWWFECLGIVVVSSFVSSLPFNVWEMFAVLALACAYVAGGSIASVIMTCASHKRMDQVHQELGIGLLSTQESQDEEGESISQEEKRLEELRNRLNKAEKVLQKEWRANRGVTIYHLSVAFLFPFVLVVFLFIYDHRPLLAEYCLTVSNCILLFGYLAAIERYVETYEIWRWNQKNPKKPRSSVRFKEVHYDDIRPDDRSHEIDLENRHDVSENGQFQQSQLRPQARRRFYTAYLIISLIIFINSLLLGLAFPLVDPRRNLKVVWLASDLHRRIICVCVIVSCCLGLIFVITRFCWVWRDENRNDSDEGAESRSSAVTEEEGRDVVLEEIDY